MSKRSCFSPLDIQIDGDVQATYENIKIVAGIADSINSIGSDMQSIIEATTDPLKTSILNAENNAAIAQTSANNALVSEQNAKNSENHTAILEQIVVEKEALVNPHYNSIDTVANNIGNVNTVAEKILVIPTETTYSLNDLESALNGLLTYQVAQAAQISILKQGE